MRAGNGVRTAALRPISRRPFLLVVPPYAIETVAVVWGLGARSACSDQPGDFVQSTAWNFRARSPFGFATDVSLLLAGNHAAIDTRSGIRQPDM